MIDDLYPKRENPAVMSRTIKSDSDDYEMDDFEQQEDIQDDSGNLDDNDDKLVDEEIYLNTSIGKKDSDFLKELMKAPIRTK